MCFQCLYSVESFRSSSESLWCCAGFRMSGRHHRILPAHLQHGSWLIQGPLCLQGQYDGRHRAAPHHRAERCRDFPHDIITFKHAALKHSWEQITVGIICNGMIIYLDENSFSMLMDMAMVILRC